MGADHPRRACSCTHNTILAGMIPFTGRHADHDQHHVTLRTRPATQQSLRPIDLRGLVHARRAELAGSPATVVGTAAEGPGFRF
jgi:hypothetical protein